jgi:hypothetical protein
MLIPIRPDCRITVQVRSRIRAESPYERPSHGWHAATSSQQGPHPRTDQPAEVTSQAQVPLGLGACAACALNAASLLASYVL